MRFSWRRTEPGFGAASYGWDPSIDCMESAHDRSRRLKISFSVIEACETGNPRSIHSHAREACGACGHGETQAGETQASEAQGGEEEMVGPCHAAKRRHGP